MWQSDGTDRDWGLRVGWHILASTLTMPGKLLTQKPLNCPHTTAGTLALFNQRFLFLKWFHLSEVRHISAFLTGACAQMLVAGGRVLSQGWLWLCACSEPLSSWFQPGWSFWRHFMLPPLLRQLPCSISRKSVDIFHLSLLPLLVPILHLITF